MHIAHRECERGNARACRLWRRHTPVAHIASNDVAKSEVPSGPWLKVAVCEEGGRDSPEFGYLGILPSTWAAYGMPGTAGDASWPVQVSVANRIEGGYVPDQDGCNPDGW